ncbi:MAG: creatininase family protein [Salinirussus sp.]
MYDSIGRSPVEWAGKSAPEVVETAEEDGSVLIVPVASLEQHGQHMPTITDTLLCTAVVQTAAEQAAEAAVPVLITPPVWSGQSRHHRSFGGTASLDVPTLMAVLEHVADTTLENGFDALLFVNGHGGNISTIGTAVQEIAETQEAEVLGLTYFQLAGDMVAEVRDSELGGIAHAGEMETSMMLHLRPDLVDEDRAEGTPYDKPYDGEHGDLTDAGTISTGRPFEAYTDTGAAGRPELASAEKGAAFFEGFTDALADVIESIHEHHG